MPVITDITINAEYRSAYHTVEFKQVISSGGSLLSLELPSNVIKTMTVPDGYILEDGDYPEMPAKPGYSFAWTEYNAPITADITVTGKYESVGSIDPPGPPIVGMSLLDGNSLGAWQPVSTGTLESTVVETHSYVYNGSKLVQETVTTETITDEDTVTTTEVLYYAYDASGQPMSVTYTDGSGAETTYYYATNLQGDVFAIFTPDGNAVVEYTYDAWGNPLAVTGTLADTLGETNSLRYRGYVYDNETGYYYLQSRYYNPELGRFINADAYASTGQGLLGNNMFAYCNNCPVLFADASGTRVVACLDVDGGGYSESPEFIYNQNDEPYGSMSAGRHADVATSGCGPVAAYNAMLLLGNYDVEFSDILGYYNDHVTPLSLAGGILGTSPYTLCDYFIDQGYTVYTINTREFVVYSEFAKTADACIMLFFWGNSKLNAGAHYAAFRQIGDVGYYYNLYSDSKDVYCFNGDPYDLVVKNGYSPYCLILIYDN